MGFRDARQPLAVSSKDNATPVTADLPEGPMILEGPRPVITLRASHTSPAPDLHNRIRAVPGPRAARVSRLETQDTAIFGCLSIAFF